MASDFVLTPYLKLKKLFSDVRNWAQSMNDNLAIIDAAISTYFIVQGLVGVWTNSTAYTLNQRVVDPDTGLIYSCNVPHTSSATPTTFTQDRTTNITYWTSVTALQGSDVGARVIYSQDNAGNAQPGSYNFVSSVRNAAGDWTVNFNAGFTDANFTPQLTVRQGPIGFITAGNTPTTTSIRVLLNDTGGASSDLGGFHLVIFKKTL